MRQALRTSALVFAIMLVAGLRSAAAQAPSIQAELLKDWAGLKDTMEKLANAMPEDKFTLKPTPAQQSFGERVVHVATTNVFLMRLFAGTAAAPMIDAKATTKAAAIKALNDSFDYGTALIKEQNDQTMMQAVANPPGFIGPSSRARIAYTTLGHTWDIYGQLAVYLRLGGGVPPASQRP